MTFFFFFLRGLWGILFLVAYQMDKMLFNFLYDLYFFPRNEVFGN
jgi:hypothetical protein